MSFVIDNEDFFRVEESKQGPNSGNGVFCNKDVKAGTILPYFAVAFKDKDDEDMDRTYVMSADYMSKKGNHRTLDGYSLDGNPTIDLLKDIENYKKTAAQINEASFGNLPNCLFVSNPSITRQDIKDSFKNKTAIPIVYVVVTENVLKDSELLTCYGKEYGERTYKPCKMKKRKYQETIDMAYEYVEDLSKIPKIEK